MTGLSQDEIKLIRAHPLSKSLETFRTTFRSRFVKSENANVREVIDKVTIEASNKEVKDIILDLILVLQSQPAARNIHSRTENGALSGDIAIFYARLSSNQEYTKQTYGQLYWTSLRQQTEYHNQPPLLHPLITSSFPQTPWSFNTGSFADTSEHRKQVDGALKEELLPSLRLDIPDFVPAVFGQVPQLDELAEELFDKCQDGKAPLYKQGPGWTKWPPSAKEELVLDWLQDLMKRLMAEARTLPRAGKYTEGRPSISMIPQSNGRWTWAQILVTGEMKSNPVEDWQETAWLDLATYVREVFRTQERRFVLGFTLCGSIMRLWHFDRAGSCGSSSFDINEDGFRFIQVMLGYHLMNDKQLGLDPTIQRLNRNCYTKITRDDRVERLSLSKEIRKQATIVGRATTCWRAYCDDNDSTEPLVVKDSWQYEERPEEGELIKEATDKGNRVHRRVITRDPGRPIYKASSRVAVIKGFIGAISGHEFLLNAGILHRDVSIGNIMLTEKEDDGFLIDLDLAIKTSDNQASGAPSKSGTKIFMAIGALLGEHHCFMHDLKSFWVLFWICIHYGGLDREGGVKTRVVTKYEKWNYTDIRELAELKIGVIADESNFDGIVEEHFTAYHQPFAACFKALRKKVFPNNQRWKTEDHRLYSAMKEVLKKTQEDFHAPPSK